MKQMMWLTLAVLSFAFNLGCERNASNKSRITLALPSELQERIEKSEVSSYTALKLKHIALQITAPDIVNPVRVILDADGDDTALPASVEVEIPPGDNRLVQLIAAYAADENDSPWIYYGDVTQSLKKSTENIVLPVYKLGGSGVSVMARISGRFLTGTNTGPTGVIDMIYRPSGKPAMPVDKKSIYGGWFETSTFEDVPMDYIITATNGSTYTLGSQWMSSSIATSERVVRFSTPDAFETYWNNGVTTFKPREREDIIVGFFANDSSLVSAKYICVTSQTDLNSGTIHAERALNTAYTYSPRPFKHFYHGTTPTYSPTDVTIVGGKRIASCGTLNYAQEFIDYLWFLPNTSMGQSTYEDFLQSMGMNEGFVWGLAAEASNGTTNRIPTRDINVNGEMYRAIKVLPGLESVVDKVVLYQNAAGTYTGGEDRCDRIKSSEWNMTGTYPAVFSGSQLLVKTSYMTTLYSSYAICMSSAGKSVGRLIYVYNGTATWLPPSRVALGDPNTIPPEPGKCVRMIAYIAPTSGGMMYPASSAINVTVASSISGSPAAVLYSDATCTSTPQSTQTITIPAGDINGAFFYKVGSASTLTFGVTANTGSLANAPDIDVPVNYPTGSLDHFIVETNYSNRSPLQSMQVFEQGCFPFRVRAVDISNQPVSLDATVNFTYEDLSGNTVSLPTGFNFYETCAAGTPISSLSFGTASSKDFVIKTSASVPQNKVLKLSGGGATSLFNINPAPLAQSLAWSHANSPANLNLVTYQCTPVTVKILDGNGNDKVASENIGVQLKSDNTNIEFFSSASCMTTAITTTTIPTGSTGSLLYVRTLTTTGSQALNASSLAVANSSSVLLNTTPSALVATPSITNPTASSSLLVTITGGNAPYTTTVMSNVSSADTPTRSGNTYQFNMMVGAASGAATVLVTDHSGQSQIVTVTVP